MRNLGGFEELCTDELLVVKKDGTRTGPFKGRLWTTKSNGDPPGAIIFDESLDVDEGDQLARKLPNGKEELCTVLEVAYNKGVSAIPSHYHLKIEKSTALPRRSDRTSATVNVYNSQGVQIGDYNTQNVVAVLESLVSEIESSDGTTEEKREAKSRLRAFMQHPLVVSILGAATGGLLGSLGD